jgi:hypothetical protein
MRPATRDNPVYQEAVMSQKEISSKEQQCISQCILDHWGEQSQSPPESRDQDYERCLSECRICG